MLMPLTVSEICPQSPTLRTKYDRMFERKNQDILSKHYSKLVDHSGDLLGEPGMDDDGFITLKRADHSLEDDEMPLFSSDTLSKRKLKMVNSKRAMLKYKGVGTKLVFDAEGEAHELYEMLDDEAFHMGDVIEEGRKFVESERSRLRDADLHDKEEAKAKKREKKRKRKGGENAVSRLGVCKNSNFCSPWA